MEEAYRGVKVTHRAPSGCSVFLQWVLRIPKLPMEIEGYPLHISSDVTCSSSWGWRRLVFGDMLWSVRGGHAPVAGGTKSNPSAYVKSHPEEVQLKAGARGAHTPFCRNLGEPRIQSGCGNLHCPWLSQAYLYYPDSLCLQVWL